MNKIYKVVYNTARGCYVVGSEFISSCNGQRSVQKTNHHAGGTALRHLVLSAVVAGAILVPVFGMPQTAGAANGASTNYGQYVAFEANSGGSGTRQFFDGTN